MVSFVLYEKGAIPVIKPLVKDEVLTEAEVVLSVVTTNNRLKDSMVIERIVVL